MPLIFVKNESKKMETLSGIYRCDAQPWWLVGGISPTQVAAVYQPRWARNEADSLLDLSGNGRNLLKIGSPTWSAANGWNIPAGGNHGYNNAGVDYVSAIVRWSGRTLNQGAALLSRSRTRLLAAGITLFLSDSTYPVYYQHAVMGQESTNRIKVATHNAESGVYSANFPAERLWVNGAEVSTTAPLTYGIHEFADTKLIGQVKSNIYQTSPVNILAVAFYSIQLTAEQHAALYQSIMNI